MREMGTTRTISVASTRIPMILILFGVVLDDQSAVYHVRRAEAGLRLTWSWEVYHGWFKEVRI